MTLLLLLCFFGSVQSCRTVSEPGVTLTGVCPNDTVTVPIGKVLNYKCTASFNTGSFVIYWNISGDTVNPYAIPLPFGISRIINSVADSTLIITTSTVLDIQCGLCNASITGINCFSSPRKFIETESVQLITFGKN